MPYNIRVLANTILHVLNDLPESVTMEKSKLEERIRIREGYSDIPSYDIEFAIDFLLVEETIKKDEENDKIGWTFFNYSITQKGKSAINDDPDIYMPKK